MPGKPLADKQELAADPLDTAGRPPVLTIQGLSITYGDVAVVRNVDLTIRPGQILGLIGESGSGKSSVAMSCLGLLGQGASSSAERSCLMARASTLRLTDLPLRVGNSSGARLW